MEAITKEQIITSRVAFYLDMQYRVEPFHEFFVNVRSVLGRLISARPSLISAQLIET